MKRTLTLGVALLASACTTPAPPPDEVVFVVKDRRIETRKAKIRDLGIARVIDNQFYVVDRVFSEYNGPIQLPTTVNQPNEKRRKPRFLMQLGPLIIPIGAADDQSAKTDENDQANEDRSG